jgi:hypothetical protein
MAVVMEATVVAMEVVMEAMEVAMEAMEVVMEDMEVAMEAMEVVMEDIIKPLSKGSHFNKPNIFCTKALILFHSLDIRTGNQQQSQHKMSKITINARGQI